MSYRDTYSLYPRAHSYSAANEQRVGSYMRTLMSYGASPSSVLNTVPTYRSRILADIACTSTPDVNEVYPHLYVGDAVAAKDKSFLRRMGINYVLNTAEGKRYTQVDTDHLYYRDCPGLRYKGFQLMDLPTTDISKYFHIAANFIDEGISRGVEKLFSGYMLKLREALLLSIPEMQSGMTATLHLHAAVCRVLVHCLMGVSRSATCAIAFLMIKRGMSLTEALALVRSRRDIHPNEGFLRQLQQLDKELRVCRIR